MRFCLFFLLLFPAFSQLCALYNGNPSAPMMPEKGLLFTDSFLSLKEGYEFDAIFARKWKMDSACEKSCGIKHFSSRNQLGVATLNLADRVEIYGGVGSMSLRIAQNMHYARIHYRTDTHFAWNLGGRFLLAYWGDLQCGLTASYLSCSPHIDSIRVNGASAHPQKGKMHYTEWQVGAALSYHIRFFYPYIGAKYATARAKLYDLDGLTLFFPSEKFVIKNVKMPGLVLGCGLAPERGFTVNVEGRFIDEIAFSVTADLRF